MNRRLFLVGLGICACSTPARIRPRRAQRRVAKPPADPEGGCHAIVLYESQLEASPLAFQGDLLAQSHRGELRVWDARAMKRTHTWTVPHKHFCFVQDGTLVAFGWPSKGDIVSVIHRVSKSRLRSRPGPIMIPNDRVMVLRARHSDEIYVITNGSNHPNNKIYRFSAAGDEAIFPHPYPRRTRIGWCSRLQQLRWRTSIRSMWLRVASFTSPHFATPSPHC